MSKKVAVDTLRDLAKKMGVMESRKIEFEGIEVEVKQYLPIEDKRILIELVVQNSFVKDDRGINRFDATIKETMLNFFIAREYTNLNTMKDPFEMYDALKATGLIEAIKFTIPEQELMLLEDMLEDRIDEEYRLQRLDVNIGHKIEGTLGILNRKLAEGIETIQNFDPSKQLNLLTEFLDEETKKKLQETQDNKGNVNEEVLEEIVVEEENKDETKEETETQELDDKIDKMLENLEK